MTKTFIAVCLLVAGVATFLAPAGFAVTFDVPQQPLGDVAAGAVAAAAFFLGNLTVVAVLLAIAVSLRQWTWALYTMLVLLGLLYIAFFEQNITGIVWSGVDISAQGLVTLGYGMLSINYLVAAQTLPHDHTWAWMKGPFCIAAVALWGMWALGRTGSLEFAHLLFSVAGCTVAIAHFFPVSTFSKLRGGYDTIIRNLIWILLTAVLIGGTIAIGAAYGGQTLTVTINRILIAAITIGFGALFIRNIFILKSDRELAVQEALDRAIEKARISEELLAAQESHRAAVEVARDRNLRLATASHDIRQPLSSLRTSFAALSREMPEDARNHLKHSLDYLDELASSYISEAAADAESLAIQERVETDESEVRAEQIGETLVRMFTEDAEGRGLVVKADVSPAPLRTEPLALMRVLCNVMSNAIAHGSPGTLHLDGRMTDRGYVFNIRNPGASELSFEEWSKGKASGGSGLGLAIVQEQADRGGFEVSTAKSDDSTTCVSITVPKHAGEPTP